MRWFRAALLAIPLVELVVAIVVGRAIGAGWTILALLAISVIGGTVIKRAGLRSLAGIDASVAAGRPPGSELADTGMLFVAGLLLLVPGFVTGVLGLLLLLPPVRALARRSLERRLRAAAQNRVAFFGPGFRFSAFGSPGGPGAGSGETFAGNTTVHGRGADGVIITGEVVDQRPREPGDSQPPAHAH